MTELLPCPFCKHPATIWKWHSLPWAIGCDPQTNPCEYHPWAIFKTKKEAIEHWNTRAASPALLTEINMDESLRSNASACEHGTVYINGDKKTSPSEWQEEIKELKSKIIAKDAAREYEFKQFESELRKIMREWQPIESAPDTKDMVMLWLDGEMWYGRRSFGKWRAKGYKDTFCEPEFWMPLPPPPNNHNREGA